MGGGFYAGGRQGVKERALSRLFRLDACLRHDAVALSDLVVHELTELLSGRAGRDARRVGNDQLDRLCGIRAVLRRRRGGRTREGQKEYCAKKRLASRQGSVETIAYHPDVMRTASDASITASYFSFIVRSSHRRTM